MLLELNVELNNGAEYESKSFACRYYGLKDREMDFRLKYTIKKLEENGMTDCSHCGHRPDYLEWMVKIAEAAERWRKEQNDATIVDLISAIEWEYDYD